MPEQAAEQLVLGREVAVQRVSLDARALGHRRQRRPRRTDAPVQLHRRLGDATACLLHALGTAAELVLALLGGRYCAANLDRSRGVPYAAASLHITVPSKESSPMQTVSTRSSISSTSPSTTTRAPACSVSSRSTRTPAPPTPRSSTSRSSPASTSPPHRQRRGDPLHRQWHRHRSCRRRERARVGRRPGRDPGDGAARDRQRRRRDAARRRLLLLSRSCRRSRSRCSRSARTRSRWARRSRPEPHRRASSMLNIGVPCACISRTHSIT